VTPVANNGNYIRLVTPYRELEEKIHLYVNSTNKRCPKKIKKTFLIENFFNLPLVVVHHELRISWRFLENIQNGLKGIFRGMGEIVS
jgi:hypothetical protein